MLFFVFVGELVSFFFFSSRRRHTRSVSAFLLNRSSDLKQASHFVHIPGLSYSGVKSPTACKQSLFESHFASRQIGRAVQQECRDRYLHSFPTRRSSDL